MSDKTTASSVEIKEFLDELIAKMYRELDTRVIGIYLHGSLAMGGFNPEKSDIDLLVVTETPIGMETKKKLAAFFLEQSNNPYPVEISILNISQLGEWQFPTPYDFHFSEYWRERYEWDVVQGTTACLGPEEKYDIDLAAHFTILNHRGICLEGRPIHEVFPAVPESDYLTSILDDYKDCLEKIYKEPIYSVLNLIRVYWYIKEGKISSKQEAGEWGIKNLPAELGEVIKHVLKFYEDEEGKAEFNGAELSAIREYIKNEIDAFHIL